MDSPLEILYDYFDTHQLWTGEVQLKRNDYLHHAGDRNDNLYYVKRGTLYYSITMKPEEREQIIRFGYVGNFVTAIDTFLTDKPTMFSGRALQRTELKVVARTVYEKVVLEVPELRRAWYDILRNLVIGQTEREIDLLTTDATERYRRVWVRSPQLFQEVPAKYIANYLRMTPETLSRIRAQQA
ncbi:Crp/Fnr family transcriptional regulator [Lewinellaceae bacterium SD302]|nr:Crp/Fnr family transcriptional regulator [Lewinellaceae bacterium SD302]